MKAAVVKDGQNAYTKHVEETQDFNERLEEFPDKEEPTVEDIIGSEIFKKEARELYEGKVQESLLAGKWYTLVEALDDTIDTWTY